MSVYNDAGFLRNSIKSILNQTFSEFEFLIIDDGSTDNTEEIISGFNDSRIIYKKIDHTGLAGALNHGISISGGDWIARIDADDLSTPDRLQKQVTALTINKDVNVISGWSVYFKDQGKILFLLKTPEEDNDIKKFLNLHNPVNHSSVMFNKKVIKVNGGYNENFKCYEDFELWFRLRNKLKFKIIPEFYTYTRLHPLSMSTDGKKNKIYKMLFDNALLNSNNAETKESKEYWDEILFRIEYFYGNKDRSRKYFRGKYTGKKALEFLNTFLPERLFNKNLDLRLRYRLESRSEDLKFYEAELRNLLRQN